MFSPHRKKEGLSVDIVWLWPWHFFPEPKQNWQSGLCVDFLLRQAATTHKEHTDYLFEHSIDSLVFFSLKSHYRNICVGKIVITMHYQIMRLSSEKEIITSIGISDIVPCWNPDSTNVFFIYRFMVDWTVIGQMWRVISVKKIHLLLNWR